MKKVLSVISLIFIQDILLAQPMFVKPLKSGEMVPDINFTINIGDSSFESSVSNYRGKIILLDFWGVECSSCIAALPKMLNLQEKFRDRFQVLVVTRNPAPKVYNLFEKFKNAEVGSDWVKAGLKLPFVSGDTIFYKMFPHVGLPTHVWIDAEGKVIATTYPNSTTVENLNAMITGEPVRLDSFELLQIDLEKPFTWFSEKKEMINLVESYALLMKRMEFGVGNFGFPYIKEDSVTKKVIEINCVNRTILDLYRDAYKELMPEFLPGIPLSRIILNTKNVNRFLIPEDESDFFRWASKNVYSYIQKLPVSRGDEFFAVMRNNLDLFLGLKSRIMKRKVKCWVLRELNNEKLRPTLYKNTLDTMAKDSVVLRNVDLNTVFLHLGNYMHNLFPREPFINKTTKKISIDLSLPRPYYFTDLDFPGFVRQLNKSGLTLVEEFVILDMLGIVDEIN